MFLASVNDISLDYWLHVPVLLSPITGNFSLNSRFFACHFIEIGFCYLPLEKVSFVLVGEFSRWKRGRRVKEE